MATKGETGKRWAATNLFKEEERVRGIGKGRRPGGLAGPAAGGGVPARGTARDRAASPGRQRRPSGRAPDLAGHGGGRPRDRRARLRGRAGARRLEQGRAARGHPRGRHPRGLQAEPGGRALVDRGPGHQPRRAGGLHGAGALEPRDQPLRRGLHEDGAGSAAPDGPGREGVGADGERAAARPVAAVERRRRGARRVLRPVLDVRLLRDRRAGGSRRAGARLRSLAGRGPGGRGRARGGRARGLRGDGPLRLVVGRSPRPRSPAT